MSTADDDEARARLRVSDQDRFAVSEVLREAAGAGRLDADELDERLERAYAARTRADLDPLVADLPGAHLGSPAAEVVRRGGRELDRRPADWVQRPAPDAEPATARHLAVMSGVQRRGDWLVPESTTVVAYWGGADLDLREARFAAPDVVITVLAVMGGATVVVPPDVDVVVEGTGVMGGFQGPAGPVEAELVPGSPRVRVRGMAFWGGVSVVRKERS